MATSSTSPPAWKPSTSSRVRPVLTIDAKSGDAVAEYEYYPKDTKVYSVEHMANAKWLGEAGHTLKRAGASDPDEFGASSTEPLEFDRLFNRKPDYETETQLARLLMRTHEHLTEPTRMVIYMDDRTYLEHDLLCMRLLVRTANDDVLNAISTSDSLPHAIATAIKYSTSSTHKAFYSTLSNLCLYMDAEMATNIDSKWKRVEIVRPLWFAMYYFAYDVHWSINALRTYELNLLAAREYGTTSDVRRAESIAKDKTSSIVRDLNAVLFEVDFGAQASAGSLVYKVSDYISPTIFITREMNALRRLVTLLIDWLKGVVAENATLIPPSPTHPPYPKSQSSIDPTVYSPMIIASPVTTLNVDDSVN